MKIRRRLTALTTALVAVVLLGQLWAFAAPTWNPGQDCFLTVNPCDPSSEFSEDLTGLDLVAGLYRIADWDGVNFTAQNAFEVPPASEATKEGWDEAAQNNAQKVLLPTVTDPDSTVPAGDQQLLGQEPGLYLVVVHVKGDTDYVTTVTSGNGEEAVATKVVTEEYTYTFPPALIAVPNQEAEEGGGDYNYDVVVNLKPERELRKGDLEIIKTLLNYEPTAPASFIFQIDWEANGQKHSDVRALDFGEAGERRLLIEDLPVNAQVTVTEVYSGASYTLVSDPEQETVIVADETVSVEFTNDYEEEHHSGGSIVNRFAYNEDEGWTWTAHTDSTEEG